LSPGPEAALARLTSLPPGADAGASSLPGDPPEAPEARVPLEGIYAPFATVLESDVEDRVQLSLAVLDILNYVAAARLAFEWIEDRPLTTGLMGRAADDAGAGNGRGNTARTGGCGQCDPVQVFIGPTGRPDRRRPVSCPRPMATSSDRIGPGSDG